MDASVKMRKRLIRFYVPIGAADSKHLLWFKTRGSVLKHSFLLATAFKGFLKAIQRTQTLD